MMIYYNKSGDVMEIRVLKYFLAVAREKNITNAAMSLHITQPTLSRQLKELEEELGKQLFIRGNKKITLTEDGLLLRKRAEEIVSLSDKTITDIKYSDTLIGGDIAIGCAETEGLRTILQMIMSVQHTYSNIRFHISSGDKQNVLEDLERGLIDFGIFIDPMDKTNYNYLLLPRGVVARKDSSLAKKGYVTKEDLLNVPLILSRQLCEDSLLMRWFGKQLSDLHVVATYSLIFNTGLMVSEGMGYAIAIDKLIDINGNNNLCFLPLSPSIEANLYIMWKKQQLFSKVASKFLDELENTLNKKSD